MKISIVIPSYGQAHFLTQAIESALAQTYKDTEVIVVDDGSTDGSLEIARGYNGTVKLIEQKNKGLASARNTGIMNATGEYVLFLDADDIMMATCVERIVRKAEETNADVIGPSIRCFTEAGQIQDTILIPFPVFSDFKEGNRLAYCSAIKREALLEIGGYSPKMDTLGGYEDLWLWYALMERGKTIVTIQDALVMYRVKAESMITKTKGKEKDLWAQIIKDFPNAQEHAKA